MLEARGVSKRYGDTHALRPTDLCAAAGRTTVLIGPSGCGKSTLLRLFVGLIDPDAGELCFKEHPINRRSAVEVRRQMGYVIQDGGLFPHLTARENAAIVARHVGWDAPRVQRRLSELAALTHFPPAGLDRYPAELSGGQRQRVGLMRALMLDPDVLLLDEPLGALDPIVRRSLQTELREIFRSLGKTVLMVTHDLGEAAYFADTIVLLRGGRVVQTGGFRDLLERPSEPFVTEFVNAQRSPIDTLGAHS